jgi:pimeloyl-ACP methyl ester carboxylesterase
MTEMTNRGEETQAEISVGEPSSERRIAVLYRNGRTPAVVWFGGFRSEMRATKADALDRWARDRGQAFVRFDYSGHGGSGGAFVAGTVSRWLEEGLAVLRQFGGDGPILVGSSMGAHIAMLAARALRAEASALAPKGLVLIAPAVDFTEALIHAGLPAEAISALETDGVYLRPSAYSADPYPITRALIEDGRRHLLLGQPIDPGCPVHILQGGRDPDVPPAHAETLLAHLPFDAVTYTFIPDGDHRLSRDSDIRSLIAAVAAMAGGGR